MIETLYNTLITIMPILAIIVFIALFFIKAGYGMFRNKKWGVTISNRTGWILMEAPSFITMFILWATGNVLSNIVLTIFFALFEIHYFQRTFVFPFLMKGKSKMPISIMLMGIVFNIINAFLIGYSLFHLDNEYNTNWIATPQFIIGTIIFISGMLINIHSDNVIRHLRPEGDTRHYFPQKGMYRFVTSANYFGELLEWIGFAILTQNIAAWIFVLWTFANLGPRAYVIRKHYREEFGNDTVGNKKCMIPFIY